MEGLEVSEVLLSYVQTASEILRLDSFFFAKEFLNDEKIIEKQPHISIKDTQAILRSFGAYSLNN